MKDLMISIMVIAAIIALWLSVHVFAVILGVGFAIWILYILIHTTLE